MPMAGRPVVQWTVEYLIRLGVQRFVIAVPPGATAVKDVVQTLFGREVEISFVEIKTASVGETVVALAQSCVTEHALVVLGDTYFQFTRRGSLWSPDPVILTAPVAESYRWCVVRTSPDGQVVELIDKRPSVAGPLEALIGVYWFPSVQDLLAAAQVAGSRDRRDGAGLSLAEILSALNDVRTIYAEAAEEWFDAGNPDRRAAASRALLAQRAFNSLEVDDLAGTITKRSTDVSKFVNEINYLRALPPQIAILFPRVTDYSLSEGDPWMTMEFYGYPTLAELFLYHRLDRSVWERIFSHLSDILWQRMASFPTSVTAVDIRTMFLGKVWERLDDLRANAVLAGILESHEVMVNGKQLANLPALRRRLEQEVEVLANNPVEGVIHGDLCLSNVLYDVRASVCRLIDPRGSFGEVGIGGDLRYDAAKMWHSLHGWYDLITADLFSLDVIEPGVFVLAIRVRDSQEAIRDVFAETFFEHFSRREITLIAGLILCGIPAFHYDHPDRQVAMYLRGLELLNEVLGDES